ncbi:MAG: M1 family aminopeptidase [Acidobacteriota bacterium]
MTRLMRGGIRALPVLAMTLILASCSRAPSSQSNKTDSHQELLAPGVSQRLAELRAETISDLAYEVFLSIPQTKDAPITGRITASFELSDPSRGVVFDFAQDNDHIAAVWVNDRPAEYRSQSEHIVIDPTLQVLGPNRITIEFTAGDGPLNRNDEFLYSLFVPARARVAMPIFDQPDLKARYRLQLAIPEDWEAISNGPIEASEAKNGRVEVSFGQTRPISTYLFAFAAGKFQVETFEAAGRAIRMLHREIDSDKVARNSEAIFTLHASALDWLESYTGLPYPFSKFDFVLIPAFQFGGMEHPGAIFYRDRSLFLDESATQRQVLGRARLIAHETAHMWFGDLVTMKWFDDVWMKEVFANFMAAKIVNPSFPEIDHDLAFLIDHYPTAYEVDRTAGANPIRQPLENLADAGSLYGNIIYDKAPVVMKHLEILLGEQTFRSGIRDYLRNHRYANATWADLVEVFDSLTETDLQSWSRVWVDEPGRPTIETRIGIENDAVVDLRLHQTDAAGKSRIWVQPLEIWIDSAQQQIPPGSASRFPLQFDQAEVTVDGASGRPVPDLVIANGAGVGYGNFRLSAAYAAVLLRELPGYPDPMIRAVGWITLWDSMLDAGIAPREIVDLALRALPREDDEQILQLSLRYLQSLFWRYLTAQERDDVAADIESVLLEGLLSASSTSVRSAYFEVYRSIATSAGAVQLLRELWQGDRAIPGLPLSEDDQTALAEALALRGVEDSEEILERQYERIENPDRRDRFAFVRPALSGDPEIRLAFFESLQEPATRKHEPWVLDAVEYLHHPLRASESEPLILPSLELLEEIQETGDIFFPLAWLHATLGGHSSPSAASIVRQYLESRPGLPPRLEGKLLQAADPLFRAAVITAPRAE